jgi:hypothetical protein
MQARRAEQLKSMKVEGNIDQTQKIKEIRESMKGKSEQEIKQEIDQRLDRTSD